MDSLPRSTTQSTEANFGSITPAQGQKKRVLFMALGSRGDVEPFLAQALLLAGDQEILCVFPEQFRSEVEELGFAFMGFDKAFLELINSPTGKQVMGGQGGFIAKIKGYLSLARQSMSMQKSILALQREAILDFKPDRVIFHAKCLYCFAAAMDSPDRYILLNAIPCINHVTTDYPHIGFGKWGSFGSFWNKKTYDLVNGARRMMIKRMLKPFAADFTRVKLRVQDLKTFEENHLQTIYAISPSLFPKPAHWPKTAYISGYLHRNQVYDQTTKPELETWLKKYPRAILLTFGSMSNTRPTEISELFVRLLAAKGIPAIINTSWGGLEPVKNHPESIFFVNHIPYDYILPKLQGVIHHGGSGTTHQACLHGCVSLIIPHIIDQYFWNRLIYTKKLGPLGVPVSQISEKNLSPLLDDFWQNETYQIEAEKISLQMKNEVDLTLLKTKILS
ncbi:glycosyltransferase [Algoriphagus namhaensis]